MTSRTPAPTWPAYVAALAEGACLAVVLFLLPVYAAKQFGAHNLALTQGIVALPALVLVFASNLWGAASDVTGRTFPLVAIGLAAYGVTFEALARATSLGAALACTGLGACGYAAAAPLVRSHVTLHGGGARDAHRGRALGALLFAETLGLAIANGVANARYTADAQSDLAPVLHAFAGVAFAGALIVALAALREPRRIQEARRVSLADALLGDLRELYTSRDVRAIVLVAFPTFAGQFVYVSLINLLLRDHWHIAPATTGRVLAMHAVFGLAVYPLAGRLADSWGGRRVLALGAVAQATKFLLLFAAPTQALAAAASMLPMFPLVTTGSATAIAEASRTTRRAGGMGIIMGTLAAGAAVGPLLGGATADAFGLRAAPLLAGLLALLTVAAAARSGFFRDAPVDTAQRRP